VLSVFFFWGGYWDSGLSLLYCHARYFVIFAGNAGG
jgi:hypothetical protein